METKLSPIPHLAQNLKSAMQQKNANLKPLNNIKTKFCSTILVKIIFQHAVCNKCIINVWILKGSLPEPYSTEI